MRDETKRETEGRRQYKDEGGRWSERRRDECEERKGMKRRDEGRTGGKGSAHESTVVWWHEGISEGQKSGLKAWAGRQTDAEPRREASSGGEGQGREAADETRF